jgi:hypothetical protein
MGKKREKNSFALENPFLFRGNVGNLLEGGVIKA